MEDEKGKRSYATSAKGLSFDFVGYKHIDANHYDFSVIVTNFGSKLRSTVYLLLPARNRSPFKYHCDHLDASLSVKIA